MSIFIADTDQDQSTAPAPAVRKRGTVFVADPPAPKPSAVASAKVRPLAIDSINLNPDTVAQDCLLAKRYNTTPGLVGAARSEFEKRAAADDAESVMAGAPGLADWYGKAPENAALAKDDLSNAAELESLLEKRRLDKLDRVMEIQRSMESIRPELRGGAKLPLTVSFKPPKPKTDGSFWQRTNRDIYEGYAQNRITTLGFLQPYLDALAELYPSHSALAELLPSDSEGQVANRSAITALDFLQPPLKALADLYPSVYEDLAEGNRKKRRNYRAYINDSPFTEATGLQKTWDDIVRAAPQMVTQISLGLLTGGATVPTMFMGTQILGDTYGELTDEGVSGGRAFLAALGNTAAQLPLERLELGNFLQIFKSSGLGQLAKNVGISAVTNFTTQWAQSYPEVLTKLWAHALETGQNPIDQFINNIGQYTLEGMYEGVLSVPWAILGGGGRIAYDLGRYRTLKRDAAFFSSLDDNARASKMKARLPQAYQDFVDHLTAKGPIESLYINPAAMRAALPDEALLYQTANDLGVSREQFKRAEGLGADIEIPLNLYQGKIAGTEISLALRGEIRTSPEGMTLTEQTAFNEKFRQQVESAIKEYRDILLKDDELKAALAPTEENLSAVYGKEGARANVALLWARANMAAQDWKEAGRDITPAQWLKEVAKLRVAVREQGQGELGGLRQAAMYRSKAATVQDFVAEAENTSVKAAKSFFHMGKVSRQDGLLVNTVIELGSDQARHIRKRHPNFTDWNGIAGVLETGTVAALGKNRVTGGDTYAFVREVGEKSFAVIAAPVDGKKGKRAVILTTFQGTPAAVRNWLKEQQERATFFQSAEHTAYPSDPEGNPGKTATTPSDKMITTDEGAVKTEALDDSHENTFFQPLNAGVDLDAPVRVVSVEARFSGQNPKVLRKRFPEDIRKQVLDAFNSPEGVVNEDTGKKIGMSGNDFHEHLSFKDSEAGLVHMEAIAALPDLMRAAKLVEMHKDNKPSQGSYIKNIHRFISAFRVDGNDYSVLLTVKEFENGSLRLDTESPVRLYHHRVEKQMPSVTSDALSIEPTGDQTTPGTSAYIVRQLLKDVNDSEGHVFLQPEARGSISFKDDETLISLFRDSADFSTFAHEIGHLFVRDMENLVATGMAPEHIVKDLESLKAFTAEFANPETLRGFYDNTFRKQRAEYQQKDFSSLSEDELALVRNVAAQEKLADAFVTYLKEGKAPSVELRPVFQRFRAWLQKLYQALSGQGKVDINDEIRGVFDRMLASDQDIRLAEKIHQAQAAEQEALNKVAQKMLTEQEQARLAKARQEAAAVSREQRLKKILQAYYRAQANRNEIRKHATETVNAMPVYAAQDQAIAEGGLNYDAVRESYGADMARALLKKRPGLLRKEGNVSLHDLAIAHGFESEETLFDAIVHASGKKAEINGLLKAEIAAREKAVRRELGLDENASPGDPDYYSEERLKALEMEARALSRASGEHGPKGHTFGTAETLRVLARSVLESMPYREASNVGRLSAAEAKQAARAVQATTDGDMNAAADAKRRQAINHAMILEALKYKHEAEVFSRALKRFDRSKRMIFKHQEQIRAVAERYKLAPGISPRKPAELDSLRDFIKNITANDIFDEPQFSNFILNEQVPKNMTLSEMREVRDLVRWIAEEGSPEEARMISEGVEGTLLADTIKTGVATLKASGNKYIPKEENTLARSGQDSWQELFAGLDHIQFMMMAADGYHEIGKNSHLQGFHSKWFRRVMEAQSKFFSMFRAAGPELHRIGKIRAGFIRRFEKTFGKRAESINGVFTPEIMREIGRNNWTAEHVWCIARNMGNAGNLKTLHEGFGLSDAELRKLTAVLNKEEWLAIQAEGDLIGKHFAETDKVFRQIYGRPMPDAVEPLPIMVATAEGEMLQLNGWYFPISVDGRMSPDIGDRQEIAVTESTPDFVAYGPTMAKGFTKGRTGTGRPVGLYFSVLETGLKDQWRFMTMAPVIRDMDRITRNAEWRKAYTRAFGPDYYRQLRAWLKYTANPVTERGDRIDRLIDSQRKLATIYSLALNVQTFIRQFQGYFQAVPDLGVKWIAKGISRTALHPIELVRHVNEQSPFMADRDKNFLRELRKNLIPPKTIFKLDVNGTTYVRQDIQNVVMSLVILGDRMTTYPIWQGAYMRGTEELNMSRNDAIAYANSIVQKTQASNSEADLNMWQRESGKSWKRLFTMFMSEALRKGSRMRYYWRAYRHKTIGIGTYVEHLCMETVVPATFYVAVRSLLSSSPMDPEDVAEQTVNELLGPLPIISQLSSMFTYGKNITDSPAFRGTELYGDMLKSAKGMLDGQSRDPYAQFFKSLVDVAAYSLEIGNIRKAYETAAQGWEDMEKGRTANPFRLFVKPSKK